MTLGKIGIVQLEGVHYYVRDLERSRRFYLDYLGFDAIAKSSDELERNGRQRSLVFKAGGIVMACSTPVGEGGRAWRYLSKHPDGIGTIVFEVEDAARAFDILDRDGGTPITEVQTYEDDGGALRTFSITTPFGDTTFRFIERRGYAGFYPGMEALDPPQGEHNPLGFSHVDHITSNFQTMKPALLWLEHVLGFERFWHIEFHTKDVAARVEDAGSGLRSEVMWDPGSGVKFANNEPYRPAFKQSQINVFHEEHRGDGVQHLALASADILHTVRALRDRGVEFMPTPQRYYELLPERLERLDLAVAEPLSTLEELEILVDGSGPDGYLLQIFLKDSAGLYGSPEAGPFFFEIIQRKGNQGFGEGNFRALFESIEHQQTGRGG